MASLLNKLHVGGGRAAGHGATSPATHANGNGAAGHDKHLISYGSSGREVIRTTSANKYTAFSEAERDKLGLRGLVPPAHEDMQKQMERELRLIRMRDKPIDKFMYLSQLRDRNETLFFRIVIDHVEEMMPLVYTPTIGEACVRWSEITTHPQGLVVTLADAGRVDSLLANWGETNVRAIVVTDGERILGLGDQGYNGLGIPIGKLALYVACGGVDPRTTLPVVLDVGTNTERIREDPLYLGVRAPRDKSPKYFALVHEFMDACKKRYGPHCLIQFEDFGHTAFDHLAKFRNTHLCFNDDIQGTAAVALAGVYSSLRVTSKAPGGAKKLSDHTFVFLGAGEAGVGIAELIALAMSQDDGISLDAARQRIWLVDSTGIVCKDRPDKLAHHKVPFAHELTAELRAALGDNAHGDGKPGDRANLAKVCAGARATVLVGVSAQPQTFTEEVVKQMCKNAARPVVFALSNPTSKCECTAEQALGWSDGRAVFATGSPFANVQLDNPPRDIKVSMLNNAYVFPGLALGVLAGQVRVIPEELMLVTSKSLAAQVTEADLATGALLPKLSLIRDVSAKIAADVMAKAFEMGIADLAPKPADLLAHAKASQYDPGYAAGPM